MAPTEGRVATAVGLTPWYPRKYSENFHTTPYHAYVVTGGLLPLVE